MRIVTMYGKWDNKGRVIHNVISKYRPHGHCREGQFGTEVALNSRELNTNVWQTTVGCPDVL